MGLRDYPARGKDELITRLAQMGSSILHETSGSSGGIIRLVRARATSLNYM
jgi:hypothetical protein